LAAQRAVAEHMFPGNEWPECHFRAERAILAALQKAGVLISTASVEEIQASKLGKTFMPHGLGHLIGCDTHDVGGYISGTPPRDEYLKSLRTARTLEAGMVLTSEPVSYATIYQIQS